MSRGVRIAGVAVMLSLFSMFWCGRTACFSVVFLRTGLVCGGVPARGSHGLRAQRDGYPTSRGTHATRCASARFYLLVSA